MMRRLLLCILCCGLLAGAETDPLVDLDPIANAELLAQLRGRLGTAPASDPALGTAQMALVNLALGGDVRDRGGCGGLWRQRARELRDLRRAAGAAPDGFVQAIPDLWVEALDGRTAACMQALVAYPEAADHPHGRALRAWCTGDWRDLRGRTQPTGAHERIALARAYWQSGMGQAVESMEHEGVPAFAYHTLQCAAVGFSHEGSAGALAAALDAVVPISVSPQLSEAGIAARNALVLAAQAAGPGEALRRALRRNDTGERGEVILAAWRLVEAGCAGPRGLRDADGGWRLVDLGDWSLATRHRLLQAMTVRHQFVRMQWGVPEVADKLSGPISAGDQGIFGAKHRHIASMERDVEAARALCAAVERELQEGTGGIPPARLISLLLSNIRSPGRLKPEVDSALVAALAAQTAAEGGRAAGWAEVGQMLQYGGRSALAKEQLAAACALDPWSVELFRLAKPADARDAPAADPLARMPWRLDQMHLRFQALQRSKSWAEAEALGARMLALDPAHAVGRAYGQCLKELGRGADALAAWRRYLAASRDFDTIFVHIDIAKELEDQGDLVGAEQHFEQAAQSWQNRAMLECADFLVRRGRGRDALVWVNRSIERYGDPRQEMRLKSASVLLAGSPAPTDIDEAFAHIEQAQAALMKKSNEVWYLGGAIRRTGQHDRFLQLVGDSWTASEGSLAARIGILAAESGRAAPRSQRRLSPRRARASAPWRGR